MSGTLFEEIQKKKEKLKKEKFKFIFSILITNFLIALLCFSYKAPSTDGKTLPEQKVLHPNFKMINTALEVLVDYKNSESETPISLIDKKHQIIIQKAYLHGALKSDPKRFKIEINEADLIKLNADSNETMIAIPEIKILPKRVSTTKQRISKYEINI